MSKIIEKETTDRVFISGSIAIKNINKLVIDYIESIIEQECSIFVGDSNGVDRLIQQILIDRDYKNIKVYCTGNYPRNNIGKWEIVSVYTSHKPNTRLYFTVKDLEMTKHCDYGFMVWDLKSVGTLSNVYELVKREKMSVVFVDEFKKFFTVSSLLEFKNLVAMMSRSDFNKADKKIQLKEKMDSNKFQQLFYFLK